MKMFKLCIFFSFLVLLCKSVYAVDFDHYTYRGQFEEVSNSYAHHPPISLGAGDNVFVIKKFGFRPNFQVWFDVVPPNSGTRLDLGLHCTSTDPYSYNYCPVHPTLTHAVRVYSTNGDGSVIGVVAPTSGGSYYYKPTKSGVPDFHVVTPGCTINYSFIDDDVDGAAGKLVVTKPGQHPSNISNWLWNYSVPEGLVSQGTKVVPSLGSYTTGDLWFVLDEHSIGIDELIGCGSPTSPPNATYSGQLWDTTDVAVSDCNTADKSTRRLNTTKIDGSINLTLNRSAGSYPFGPSTVSTSTGTYTLGNIPIDTSTNTRVCTNNFSPISSLTGFKYVLKCVTGNITNVAITSEKCATFRMTTSTTPFLSLGFDLVSTGWYTVQDGDAYAGDTSGTPTSNSLSKLLPKPTQILGGFTPYLINGGIGFAGNDINVRDADNNNALSSSNTFAKHMEPSSDWPEYMDYAPPSGAVPLTTCNATMFSNLNSSNVYRVTSSCLSSALASATSYTVNQTQRLVVIYVTGSSDLVFSNELKSLTNRSRIIFISEAPVVIERGVGSVSPTPSMDAHIQAAIISKGNITFEGTTDSAADPDTTVIMEGPIVTGGDTSITNIDFKRDRGSNNGYPGVYIKFNPDYLVYLTRQSRESATENFSGLTEVKITWEEIE